MNERFERFLCLLVCPACQGNLEFKIFEENEDMPKEGLLICRDCSLWFPITKLYTTHVYSWTSTTS